jgi:capsule polysaccharide export protein KpsE/RkpR
MTSAVMKFDTLSWAKKLEQAGVPTAQAEVQVQLIFRVIDDNICKKSDLCESEAKFAIKLKELELKIELVKKDLIVAIEKVKASINTQIAKWVLGVSAIQTTVLMVLIRTIH